MIYDMEVVSVYLLGWLDAREQPGSQSRIHMLCMSCCVLFQVHLMGPLEP